VPSSFRKVAIAFALITAAVTISTAYFFLDETAPTSHEGSNKERYAMVSVAADAFIASPLVGHGSWFSATHLVRKIEDKRMKIEDGFGGYNEQEAAAISIHSQLLVSLAEGGFFGGLFFIVYGALVIWGLFYALHHERPQQALLLFTLIGAIWDLAMSPFSGPARVHIAAAAVVTLLLWLECKGLIEWKYPPVEDRNEDRGKLAQPSYS
jgi:O-antigen ligase